jgi:hypothetical protein
MNLNITNDEAQIIYDALIILSPDDPDTSEFLEDFVSDLGDVIGTTDEHDLELCERKMALVADALDILNPEDPEAQELAEDLSVRVRAELDADAGLSM